MVDIESLLIEALVFGLIALLVYIFRDKFKARERESDEEDKK